MIRILEGDVTLANEVMIVHQVNAQGKMGSGVAKAVRVQFPNVYHNYYKACNLVVDKKELLGEVLMVVDKDKIIANLFGQLYYGYDKRQYTDLNALKEGFNKIKDYCIKNKISSIAMPYKIGSCLGGANWNDVYKIIEDCYSDGNIDVVLYKL